MKTLGYLAIAASMFCFYQAKEKADEISRLRADQGWNIIGAVAGWLSVGATIISGQWYAAIPAGIEALVSTRGVFLSAHNLQEAELAQDSLTGFGVISVFLVPVFFMGHFAVSLRHEKRRRHHLEEELRSAEASRRETELQKEAVILRRTQFYKRVACGMTIIVLMPIIFGIWYHARLKTITTQYVQDTAKMGKDAHLISLNRVALASIDQVTVHAQFEYFHEGKKAATNWSFNIDPFRQEIQGHHLSKMY